VSARVLVLGERALAAELAGRLGAGAEVARFDDAYEALAALADGAWPAVVLTAPRGEFAGLCRAARRLQEHAALLAVCPPAAEADVRTLAPRVLDDYFIHPPMRRDWERIAAAAGAPPAEARPPTARDADGGLSLPEISELIAAARSPSSLEAHVAGVVGERLGTEAAWVDAGAVPAGAKPLLTSGGRRPRALVAKNGRGEMDASSAAFVSALQACLPAAAAAAERTQSLHRLAITDHLTGAYNRRYFYHLTDRILRRVDGRRQRATLLLYDIDDFKRYNDTYGHAAGDEILRETAWLMKTITRSHDVVARIGGDEFAVLFWDAERPRSPDSQPPSTAYDLADRFRQAVGTFEFRSLGPEAKGVLTISGGLAAFPGDGRTCRELLRAADRALRQAKESGKNAIRIVGAD
jgi:diguanylate cyclase (GGDEF)-like protein